MVEIEGYMKTDKIENCFGLDYLFKKVNISSGEEFDNRLNNLLEQQDVEYQKLIRILISRGIAYEQVLFERDVAISQLNDLGIGLGEKIQEERNGKNKGSYSP